MHRILSYRTAASLSLRPQQTAQTQPGSSNERRDALPERAGVLAHHVPRNLALGPKLRLLPCSFSACNTCTAPQRPGLSAGAADAGDVQGQPEAPAGGASSSPGRGDAGSLLRGGPEGRHGAGGCRAGGSPQPGQRAGRSRGHRRAHAVQREQGLRQAPEEGDHVPAEAVEAGAAG